MSAEWNPQAAPEVRGIAPYLQVSDAAGAADFYKKAFAAEEVGRAPPDDQGRYLHIHLYIHTGSLMLCDPMPDHGYPLKDPQAFTLHLQVDDAYAWARRAVEAGCAELVPVQRMFWGDDYGQVKDPYGVLWSFGSAPKS